MSGPSPDPLGPTRLDHYVGGRCVASYTFVDAYEITIGYAQSCSVAIADATLLPLHASIVRSVETGEPQIVNHGPRKSVRVNGARPQSYLAPGDELIVGTSRFFLHYSPGYSEWSAQQISSDAPPIGSAAPAVPKPRKYVRFPTPLTWVLLVALAFSPRLGELIYRHMWAGTMEGHITAEHAQLGTWTLRPLRCISGRRLDPTSVTFLFPDYSPVPSLAIYERADGTLMVSSTGGAAMHHSAVALERCKAAHFAMREAATWRDERDTAPVEGTVRLDCPALKVSAEVDFRFCKLRDTTGDLLRTERTHD